MNYSAKILVGAFCLGAVTLQTSMSFGQAAKELVGTWSFVAVNVIDGEKKFEPFGPNVRGLLVLDGKRFSIIVMRDQLPKISTNNRMTATAQENQSIVQGSLAYFGSYTVDEAGKAIAMKVDASSYPNWTGTEQKRMYQLSGNDLVLTNPAGSVGGIATIRLRRSQ